MIAADLIDALDELIDLSRAADWDPVGLQVGSPLDRVDRVGVCHEITATVIDEALSARVTTLVTYHPLIFAPTMAFVEGATPQGRALALARARVSVIVVHTAFDAAPGGTAESLARAIGLIGMLGFACQDGDPRRCIGRIGTVETVSLGVFASMVAGRLDVPVRVAGDAESMVERVSVIPGSGGSFVDDAADISDVLVTGDVKHHDARRALDRGVAIIDAGHIATERPGVEALYAALSTLVDDIVWVGGDPDPWKE
jgi:dinuclear metal center YbgI/SA1388 family protein